MKENMFENFEKLEMRVLDSLEKTDLENINKILKSISEPTLTTGVGGSSVVSNFLSKVLNTKNNIICENTTFRDLNYKNLNNYKNIITCSYGGRNHGVNMALKNNLNHYLLSRNTLENYINIKYETTDIDKSFISLSATLIPLSIILMYYTDNDLNLIKEILQQKEEFNNLSNLNNWEVLSGHDTNTAHSFLESTMVESGFSNVVVHDKYEYCHGRSNLNYNYHNNLIFFNNTNELDLLYQKELPKYYDNIIEFNKKYEDDIINDYYLTYQSMLLMKDLAKEKNIDLCNINYSPIVKKIYLYKGEM